MISIITPVYNSKEYLNQSIVSVLNQTYSDFELLLIDDGSIDGSSEICDEYAHKDSRIKVIHQKNQGQSVARNRALNIARGDYIAFVDSDDYVHQKMLEVLVLILEKSEADIAVCGHVSGTETDYQWESMSNQYELYPGKVFLRESVLNKTGRHWLLWDKLYKRSCFDSIRLPEGRIYEDNATVYKLLYNADTVAVTDDVFYYYFTNENSTVNQSFKSKHLDWLIVLEEMIPFFKHHHENEMLDWANNLYLTSLADLLKKARANNIDASIIRSLHVKLQKQYNIEKLKYKIDLNTYPMVVEELYPKKAKLFWTMDGIKSKLRRK